MSRSTFFFLSLWLYFLYLPLFDTFSARVSFPFAPPLSSSDLKHKAERWTLSGTARGHTNGLLSSGALGRGSQQRVDLRNQPAKETAVNRLGGSISGVC